MLLSKGKITASTGTSARQKMYELVTFSHKFVRVKRIGLRLLHKIYGFDSWHLSPINERPYAIYIVKSLNQLIKNGELSGNIVEVGCGLGGIIGNIKGDHIKKYGYDIAPEALRPAKLFHPRTKFIKGSFDEVNLGRIDCLIFVNFVHSWEPERLERIFDRLMSENRVGMIVKESFYPENHSTYKYSHKELVGDKYKIIKRRGFGADRMARRYIEIWKLNTECK